MRDTLKLAACAILFVFVIIGFVSYTQSTPTNPPPPETTPRLLNCDPEFWAGKRVRIRTAGMEPGKNANEVYYRKQTDQPPVVVCLFDGPAPNPIPEHITGICIGRHGVTVLVMDCR